MSIVRRRDKQPALFAYLVTEGSDDKDCWEKIGAAWEHRDSDGFNLKLDFLPHGDTTIVLRAPFGRRRRRD
jgi:hypothetical protein